MAYPNETFAEGGWLSGRIFKELTNAYGRSDSWSASHNVADPVSWRQSRQGESEQSIYPEAIKDWEAAKPVDGCIGQIWQVEPGVGRVVDGLASRLDEDKRRVKLIGNGQVPQCMAAAWLALKERFEDEGM